MGAEPVAITSLSYSTSRSYTRITPGSSTRPAPRMTSMSLSARNSVRRESPQPLPAWSRCQNTRSRPPSPVPASDAPGTSRAATIASKGRSSAFDGMQAQYEHSPPRSSRSTTVIRTCLSRRRNAAAHAAPVEPPPSTTTRCGALERERGSAVAGEVDDWLHGEERADGDDQRARDGGAEHPLRRRRASGRQELQLGGRAHEHRPDDGEIVVEADHRRRDADDHQPRPARVVGGRDDVVLAEEAAPEREAGEAQHEEEHGDAEKRPLPAEAAHAVE